MTTPALAPETVMVAPASGVSAGDAGALRDRLARELGSRGYRVVGSPPADATLETTVAGDESGCVVSERLRAGADVLADGQRPCAEGALADAASALAVDLAVLAAPRAPSSALAVGPPPETPRPPTLPLPYGPPPRLHPYGDGYVFEAGITRLETGTFAGLGHAVIGTDRTDRFRGAFGLTVVGDDIDDFAGALELVLGTNETRRFRGVLAAGLLTNDVGDFAGVASLGLRKTAVERFAGVAQVTVGVNDTTSFNGGLDVALVASFARDFHGLAQIGVVNGVERSFAGGAQVGFVDIASGDYAGLAQLGCVSAVTRGVLRAAAQIGCVNIVEHEVQAGVQVAGGNLFGHFRGGLELGALYNILGTAQLGRLFLDDDAGRTPAFEGGAQVGLFNASVGAFEGGLEIGGFNLTKGSFEGGAQIGAASWVTDDFEGALEVGAVNVVGKGFSGFSQVGVVNAAREVRGVQVGLVNVAGDLHGLQIGVINVERRRAVLPLTLLANVDL